jgi:large subunit ribosomal protein L30
MAEKLLKVTQVRSELGHVARNRGTIRALGLDRIGHSNILPDNDAVRGAIRQVRFLVEAVDEAGAKVVAAKKVKHAKHAKKAKAKAKVKK